MEKNSVNLISLKCPVCSESQSLGIIDKGKAVFCSNCESFSFIRDYGEKSNYLEEGYSELRNYEYERAMSRFEDAYHHAKNNADTDMMANALLAKIQATFGINIVRGYESEKPTMTIAKYYQDGSSVYKNKEYIELEKIKRDNYSEAVEKNIEVAKKIEELRQELQRRVEDIKTNDVFICAKISAYTDHDEYKKPHDSNHVSESSELKIARQIEDKLEKEYGMNVFFANTDLAGVKTEVDIMSNLIASKLMIVVASNTTYLNSVWVQSEWKRWISLMSDNWYNKIILSKAPESMIIYMADGFTSAELPEPLLQPQHNNDLEAMCKTVHQTVQKIREKENIALGRSQIKEPEPIYIKPPESIEIPFDTTSPKQGEQIKLAEDDTGDIDIIPFANEIEMILRGNIGDSAIQKNPVINNYNEANYQTLIKASEQGDSLASKILANRYFSGKDVPEKSELLAYSYLNKSYQDSKKTGKYDAVVIRQLAERELKGIGTSKNEKSAFERLSFIASKDPEAAYTLALMYAHGIYVSKDDAEAFNILSTTAKNNLKAKLLLGVFYERGLGTEQNFEEAVKLYREIAETESEKITNRAIHQAVIEARLELARCSHEGIGMKKNLKLRIQMLVRAANLGSIQAKMMLVKLQYVEETQEMISDQEVIKYIENVLSDLANDPEAYAQMLFYKAMFVFYGRGVEKSVDQSRILIEESAKGKCIDAIYAIYENESFSSIQVSLNEVEQYIKEAASDGDTRAMYLYATNLLSKNHITPKMREIASKYLSQAAEKNYALAYLETGKAYYFGLGMTKDSKKGIEYLQKAMAEGSAESCYILGNIYLEGKDLPRDRDKAKSLFEEAHTKKYYPAAVAVAKCYRYGYGCISDLSTAYKLFEQYSKDDKEGESTYELALMVIDGINVAKDEKKAFELLTTAAEKGFVKAIVKKAECIAIGRGTEQNREEAYNLLTGREENEDIKIGLIKLLFENPDQRYAQALEMCKELAREDNAEAQYLLAESFLTAEKGNRRDEEEAFKWYKKSYDGDFSSAKLKLGYCYYTGTGVGKNITQALKFWEMYSKDDSRNPVIIGDIYYFGGAIFEPLHKEARENHLNKEKTIFGEEIFDEYKCQFRYDIIERNFSKAVEWYNLAVEQKEWLGFARLGLCHYLGNGIIADPSKAFELWKNAYKYAGANKSLPALYLGKCYFEGIGEPKNVKKSLSYFEASDQPEAVRLIYEINSKGIGVDRNLEKAFNALLNAKNKSNALWFLLGKCYYLGEGTIKNVSAAAECFKKCSDTIDEAKNYLSLVSV